MAARRASKAIMPHPATTALQKNFVPGRGSIAPRALGRISHKQCVEHLVAQRIANLRVQSPEIASSYLL